MDDRPEPLVLVVEDEPRNLALLRALLGRRGYELVTVESLAGARTWLRDRRPDLVLLDRRLPDGDGLDLARDLKGDPVTAAVPLVLLSASVLPADERAAAEAGCDAFLPKPLELARLLAEVERLLAAGGDGPAPD